MRNDIRIARGLVLFAALACGAAAFSQPLGTRVLKSVQVSRLTDEFVARVEFSVGMQYLSHIPPGEGLDIKVSLGARTRLADDLDDLSDSERLGGQGVDSPLREVVLDLSNPTNPILIVQFSERVEFSVRGGNDFRSITIAYKPVLTAAAPAPAGVLAQAPVEAPEAVADDSEVARLYNSAREAFVAGDYDRAIQLATSAVERGTPETYREALELLGMAREIKGQMSHATAEYKRYIELYEDTRDVSRVRQRLDTILTAALPAARDDDRVADAAAGGVEAPAWDTQRYGGFSQYYYRDSLKTDDAPSQTTRSSLVSDINLTTRSTKDAHLVESRLTASYEYDHTDDDPENVWRVNEAFVSWGNLEQDTTILLGRESRSTDGVLGRYDGILLSKRLSSRTSVNLVAGYPVSSTRDSVETARSFYSLSLDLGTFNDRWDFNVYFTERDYDGLTDRQAVGGEFRYFNNGLSLFGLVDYDTSFGEVNTALFLGNWFRESSSLFFSLDYRKSPSLSLGNALLGQPDTDMNDLKSILGFSEIQDLAQAHTADSMFTTIGYSRSLSERHQVSFDVTASKLGETTGSDFLPATAETPTEYFYNLQWISNGLLKERDSYIVGYKYEDLARHTRHTVSVNARIPVTEKWKINPRVSWSTRESDDGLDTQDKLKASLNVIYRINRDAEIEAEVGTERYKDEEPLFSGTTDINYFFIGYRKYF